MALGNHIAFWDALTRDVRGVDDADGVYNEMREIYLNKSADLREECGVQTQLIRDLAGQLTLVRLMSPGFVQSNHKNDSNFEFLADSVTNKVIESMEEVKMVGETGIPPVKHVLESAAGQLTSMLSVTAMENYLVNQSKLEEVTQQMWLNQRKIEMLENSTGSASEAASLLLQRATTMGEWVVLAQASY